MAMCQIFGLLSKQHASPTSFMTYLFGPTQEEHDVQMLRGPHGSIDHIHLCAGIVKFNMMSIFKSWFLGKIWLYHSLQL